MAVVYIPLLHIAIGTRESNTRCQHDWTVTQRHLIYRFDESKILCLIGGEVLRIAQSRCAQIEIERYDISTGLVHGVYQAREIVTFDGRAPR